MSDTDPLRGPPTDDLERAFRLPPTIAGDAELQALFNTIVARFKREASGLPMNTVSMLLLERMATHYVMTKVAEENSTFTPTMRRDANSTWLAMTSEFNKLLEKSSDKRREALLEEVQAIVTEVLGAIQDDDERRTARRKLSEAFAAIEI